MTFVRGLIVGIAIGAGVGGATVWAVSNFLPRASEPATPVEPPSTLSSRRDVALDSQADAALDAEIAGQLRASSGSSGAGLWQVKRSRSAVTDVETIELTLLRGSARSSGAPIERLIPSLQIFCRGAEQRLTISSGLPHTLAIVDNIEFLMRLDGNQAEELSWPAGDGLSVEVKQELVEPMVRKLAAAETVAVQITPPNPMAGFQGTIRGATPPAGPVEAVFDVQGLSSYLPELTEKCHWRLAETNR
jgi:hypothetical protein